MGERSYSQAPSSAETCLNYTRYLAPKLLLGQTPRLYSAGELGSIHSYLYQGSGNLGECMAFGRISGRNAASEIPWSTT